MSNTLTNVNDALVVSEGLSALKAGMVPLTAFSNDYSPMPAQKGATVYVPLATARSAAAYGGTYISGDTTIASAAITLDQHYKASWHLTEAEAYGSSSNLFALAGKECAYALAKQVVTAGLALIDTDTYGNVEGTSKKTVASTAFDSEVLADLVGMGINRGWDIPNKRASLFVNSTYYAALLKDPSIVDRSASGADTISSGFIRTTYGVDVYCTASYLPTSQETNLVGFMAVKDAIAVAVRPIEPLGDAYDFAQIVSDPASGVSMSYRRWVDNNTGLLWGTYTSIYGVVASNAAGAISILSA